jgi:glycosyltransferase involved in cell wall biosynthesis
VRIAQVITLFLPDFVGGATLACARLTRALTAHGHQVAVFCGRPDAASTPYGERDWMLDGVPVTGVNVASGYVQLDARNYRHPEVTPVFERFLDRQRPDVVHFHSLQALGANLLEAAAARDIPIVLTLHDWWWFCVRLFLVDPDGFVCPARVESARCHCAVGFDFSARRRHLTAMLAHTDRVLTPSRFLADAAIANGVPRALVEVCPNGVDLSPFTGRRRPGPVRFGYFGGPDNRLKGLPTLVAAAGALEVGGWELVLYGAETTRRHLSPRVTDRVGHTVMVPAAIADRVQLRPAFAPEALGAVLGTLDCLIVPSLMRESYSLVTREALAAGVPVIASDSGSPTEIVRSGINGLVFATGDACDLADHMRRLVMDTELRAHLRAGAAATRVRTVAHQVEQLERLYAEVAGGRGAGLRVPDGTALRQAGGDDAPVVAPNPVAQRLRSAGRPATVAATPLRHVLFVTGIDGSPLRYRVTNLRDQLDERAVSSRVYYFTDPALPSAIAAADLVVLYRVPMGRYVRACIALARRLGRPLVFSCDDLIFDPALTPAAALTLLPAEQRAAWLAYTKRYAETLRACDAFLGTTEPLVAAAARAGVPGFVIRNGLGAAQLAVAEVTRREGWQALARAREPRSGLARRPRESGVLRLAYLSGTIMHDLDFATIEPVLAAVLEAVPAARLRLVGYLRPSGVLAPFRERVERLPFLPWQDLFAHLVDVDVNLAPLRWPDPFSNAKSEVKYLEAAALAVPTVATPTAAFRHAVRHGENGALATTADEWQRMLLRLLDDAGWRHRLGNAARDDVFLHYTPAAQADTLLAVLRMVHGTPGPSARPPRSAGSEPAAPRTPGSDTRTPAAIEEREPGPGTPTSEAEPDPTPASYPGEVGRYDLEPENALAGAAQLSRDTPSPFLLPGRAVGQAFRATADGLCRIDVAVGTDGRVNSHRLVVHLTEASAGLPTTSDIDGAAPELRRVTIDAATLADGAWVAAEFASLTDSAGRALYVWVESEGASEGNAVTLWTYERGWGEEVPGGLHIDHHAVPGSLCFRTFHRPSVTSAAKASEASASTANPAPTSADAVAGAPLTPPGASP